MKKVIKSYAEKICSRSLISDIKIEEVKSKEPELFLNDNIVQAIRFYDIEYIIDKDKTYSSEKENVTNWIYYGRRMSVAELKRIYGNDPKYSNLTKEELPRTENLVDTIKRVVEYFKEEIEPELKNNKKIIIVAHGNSLRGLIKYLDNISDEDIISLELETGNPICYELEDDLKPIKHYYLK